MASNSIIDDIGKVDNLSEPERIMNRKDVILGIIITFLTISSIGATGRLYIRARITRNLGLDDLFVFFSMLSNSAAAITLFLLVTIGGLGKHFILLGPDGMQMFLLLFYVANALYNMSTALIKLALLFQYLRISEKSPKLRTLSILFIVIVSLWGTAFSILAWMPCLPVSGFWSLSPTDNSVIRYAYGSHDVTTLASTFFAHAASNMFLDMIIFSIPVALWMRSNPERKTRIALQGLFVLGAIVNICSVFRLIALVDNRAATFPTFDPTWYGSSPIVLSALEAYLATLCASLPVFWPIVKDALGSKKIIVTHEVLVKTESRTRDSLDFPKGRDLRSPSVSSNHRPWEHVGNEYHATQAIYPSYLSTPPHQQVMPRVTNVEF
ncbi:hypothetical protein N0V93_008135 [Gnomoniopsis smithogilvyi]|uniref:Rhodopsin domain-containing protein n=1 Tax=Gnomoniopsis smithogilvyi TaxID=1191159 RepID=A0A9W9CTF0_9PEZI|nr:hypothetical protein N0V93_008135 [Gnomoniopsis smithogilvyi]